MFERLGEFVVTRRWVVLGFIFLLTLGAASVTPGITFDFTPQALFEQQDDVNEYAVEIRQDFGDDTNTLMVLWRGDSVYDAAVLEDIATMTEELEGWERARRVLSITNVKLPRNETVETKLANGELESEVVLDLSPLVSERPVTPERAADIERWVRNDDTLDRLLVSRDGDMTAIVVELEEDARQINVLIDVVDEMNEKMEAWSELPSKPSLQLSGLPQVRVDIIRNLQDEQVKFLPLIALFMVVLLGWMFRTTSGVILPLIGIFIALIWSVAMLVIINQPINIINSVLPTLLMVIGLSDGIHLLSRAAEESAMGKERDEIVKATVRRIGLACMLTSMTTAIGFGSLIMSRTEILRDFGLHTAAGVMLAYLSTILVIPTLLTFMKPPTRSGLHQEKPGLIERVMGATSKQVLAKPVPMLALGAVITAVAIAAGAVWGKVDTRLLEVFPDDHPTAELTREVNSKFSGVLPLIISIEAKEKGYFEDPENLEKLKTIQNTVEEADPELVLKTGSVYDMLQIFREAFVNEEGLRHTPFDNERQVTTILRKYREGADSDVRRVLDDENRHALITVRLNDMGIERGRAAIGTVADTAEELFGEGAIEGVREGQAPTEERPVQVRFAGDVYLASIGMSNFIWDLIGSLGLASILIFFAMTFLFRSLRLGLISIIPNAMPLILTFGYMSWRGIELNTSTVVIFSISLGLAVDDTIHFLTRYDEERRDGFDVAEALRRTYLGAGRAIVITSIVLVGGLGVLLMSDFNPTMQFAELTSCTVVGAIIGDLILLPAALLLFDSREMGGANQKGTSDESSSAALAT